MDDPREATKPLAKAPTGPGSSVENGQTKEPELDTALGNFRELRSPSAQPDIGHILPLLSPGRHMGRSCQGPTLPAMICRLYNTGTGIGARHTAACACLSLFPPQAEL